MKNTARRDDHRVPRLDQLQGFLSEGLIRDGSIRQLGCTTRAAQKASLPVTSHQRRAKLFNVIRATCRLLPQNASSLVALDETALLNKAFRQTGLEDLGDESFRQPLKVLLQSLESDARLNLIGRVCAHSEMLRLLCNRIRMVEDRKRHPEIAQQTVRRPLFITGLPRTGSTLLHALLAQDPASRAPLVWEVMHPSPPPGKASRFSDPRIAKTARELKWLDILMPGFKTVHLIDARLPQECIAITGHAFISYVFESMFFVSSYRIWHEDRDKRPAYDCHKQFLQHLQWGCPRTHWVLKAPSHLLAMETLFQVYPDAGIIMTHRDPLKVLASCASFSEILRRPFTDCLDMDKLGTEVTRRWAKGAHLAIQFRQSNGHLRGHFLDVWYADLVRDPMALVQQIYRHFHLELTDRAENAMRLFLRDNPQNKNGVHRYSLEDFGLDRETERSRFQFYTDFFGIGPES